MVDCVVRHHATLALYYAVNDNWVARNVLDNSPREWVVLPCAEECGHKLIGSAIIVSASVADGEK
jgi:hypothetical protein